MNFITFINHFIMTTRKLISSMVLIFVLRGEIALGVIGKNGSGKSTFLKLILKELEADRGSVKSTKNNQSFHTSIKIEVI